MQIIENFSCHNHYDCLLALCKQADELLIASPFCFPNFETFVSNVSKKDSTRKITFITTMKNDEAVEKIRTGSYDSAYYREYLKNKKWTLENQIDEFKSLVEELTSRMLI